MPIRGTQEAVDFGIQIHDFESRGRPLTILKSPLNMPTELVFELFPKQSLDLCPRKRAPIFDHSIHARFYDHKAGRQEGRALPCKLRVCRPQGYGYGLGDKISEMDAAAEHIAAAAAAGVWDTGQEI